MLSMYFLFTLILSFSFVFIWIFWVKKINLYKIWTPSHKQHILKKPKLFRFCILPHQQQEKEQRQLPHCSLGGISVGYLNSIFTVRNTIPEYSAYKAINMMCVWLIFLPSLPGGKKAASYEILTSINYLASLDGWNELIYHLLWSKIWF